MCGTGGPDGRIIVGGRFTKMADNTASPPVRGHIAAITPSGLLDPNSFAGAGTDGTIYALQTEGGNSQGNLLIGGNFTSYNGVGRHSVARAQRNGNLDNSFSPSGYGPNGTVNAITWTNWGINGMTIGKAILGGSFTDYNAISTPGVAVVQASLGANTAPINFLLLMGD